MSQIAPNPHDPPRSSWAGPILIGALVTMALHSPALWASMAWLAMCLTCGCSGLPVGAVPALLALRNDPRLGAASGFAVAFISVGLGGIVLAGISFADWDPTTFELRGEFEQSFRARLQEEGYTEAEVDQMIEDLESRSRFVPVITAGLMALMGGLAGALAAAIVGRRQRPPPSQWGPPSTPGSPPPPS